MLTLEERKEGDPMNEPGTVRDTEPEKATAMR